MTCVAVAMVLANYPATMEFYHAALNTDLAIKVMSPLDPDTGMRVIEWSFPQGMTVEKFVNDVLMVVFFFTVGLEIKREMVSGELSSKKKAMLPVMAALGGMVVPALIYSAINHSTAAQSGWGIPTATDIAFAVKEGFRRGYTRFVILGGLGGNRLSHTIANMQLLEYIGETKTAQVVLQQYQHVMYDFLTKSITRQGLSTADLLHNYFPYDRSNLNCWYTFSKEMKPILESGIRTMELSMNDNYCNEIYIVAVEDIGDEK